LAEKGGTRESEEDNRQGDPRRMGEERHEPAPAQNGEAQIKERPQGADEDQFGFWHYDRLIG
jgi:hypothetical protein